MRDKKADQMKNKDGLEEKVLLIRRISKKTQGGNYINFSALVVVGDKKGKVGLGLAKGLEVPQAIRKAIRKARKSMISVPIHKGTLPHELKVKFKSAVIILKPAPKGAGLKVGSVVRSIMAVCGFKNASGKIIRSNNQITNAYAVIKAFKLLKPKNKL